MRAGAAQGVTSYDERPNWSKMPLSNGRTELCGGDRTKNSNESTQSSAEHHSDENSRRLSSRENEVLHWLAFGKSGPEIAIILGISTCTVRIHIQSVKRKLDAVNIPHAVYLALVLGVLRI